MNDAQPPVDPNDRDGDGVPGDARHPKAPRRSGAGWTTARAQRDGTIPADFGPATHGYGVAGKFEQNEADLEGELA